MRILAGLVASLALVATLDSSDLAAAEEDGWGHLKITFKFVGMVPPPTELPITKDVDHLGKSVPDESLVVDRKSLGIANVLAYVYSRTPIKVHPSYEMTAREPVTMEMKGARFHPRVVLIRTTQTLLKKNSDPVVHCAKIDLFENPPSGLVLPVKGTIKREFTQAERLPCPVSCAIHPWMQGWILIRDDPYMAVSDRHGELHIHHLPAGRHSLRLWHERVGYLRDLKHGVSSSDSRGRLSVDIQHGETLELEFELPAKTFAEKDK